MDQPHPGNPNSQILCHQAFGAENYRVVYLHQGVVYTYTYWCVSLGQAMETHRRFEEDQEGEGWKDQG